MANIDNPGIRPADRKPSQELEFPVDVSSGTAMYVGDVVTANAAGSVRPAVADDGTSVAGVVVGIKDTNGIPIGAHNSVVSTKYLSATTVGKALIALALPGRVFIGQSQTGQTPAEADIFSTTDHVAGAGNSTTAKSGHELNMSDKNTGAQCLIVGKVDDPGNSYGEHVDLRFVFHESIFMGVDKTVGV